LFYARGGPSIYDHISLPWAVTDAPEIIIPSGENTWTFGQWLPVVLLALPVLGIVEKYYGRHHRISHCMFDFYPRAHSRPKLSYMISLHAEKGSATILSTVEF